MIGALLWIPAFAGMTGETCVGGNPWLLCSFSMIILRHSRVGGNPWLLCSFSMITLRHSHIGGNPWLLCSFSMITLRHSRVGGNPWLPFSFSVITLSHSRVGGNPWLPFSFSMIILRHSRVGGNPLGVTVIHTDHSTRGSFPESTEFSMPCSIFSGVFHVLSPRSSPRVVHSKPTGEWRNAG